MSLPLRTRTVPQCTACIRRNAWSSFTESPTAASQPWRQQVRGRKRIAKSTTTTVRLLKDMVGYGRRGSIIPVPTGEMRNKFFPRRIAEYVTLPELKPLRTSGAPIERDYLFGKEQPVGDFLPGLGGVPGASETSTDPVDILAATKTKQKKVEPEKLTPERSIQLLEIFIKPTLQFYRTPIPEENEEKEPEPEEKPERRRSASSAAADLLAARSRAPLHAKSKGPQPIYGSVSAHDILVHVRTAIAINDEAAKVILNEENIEFFDEALREDGRIKHVGDFTVFISVKGTEDKVKRTVKVIPQEA